MITLVLEAIYNISELSRPAINRCARLAKWKVSKRDDGLADKQASLSSHIGEKSAPRG
jgi:hypothetical protein